MAWHRTESGSAAIRLAGAALLGVAALAAARLFGPSGPAQGEPLASAYLLALAAFVCASGGSVMLLLGAHLFDEVEVSAHWMRQERGRRMVRDRRRDDSDFATLFALAPSDLPAPWRRGAVRDETPGAIGGIGAGGLIARVGAV